MFTHILVLLCGCAYALSDPVDIEMPTAIGPPPPPYVQAWNQYKVLAETLKENLVSVSDNIPHFNDSRRHFTIIFNVINEEAVIQGSCLHLPYDEDYMINLDHSVPKAMDEPLEVTAEAMKLLNSVEHYTKNISKWTEHCPGSVLKCNQLIEEMVQKEKDTYERDAEMLLTAGKAARQLNRQSTLYKDVSDHLSSLQFVVTGQQVLKKPVMALADVHRLISYYDIPSEC